MHSECLISHFDAKKEMVEKTLIYINVFSKDKMEFCARKYLKITFSLCSQKTDDKSLTK